MQPTISKRQKGNPPLLIGDDGGAPGEGATGEGAAGGELRQNQLIARLRVWGGRAGMVVVTTLALCLGMAQTAEIN